MPRIDSVRFFKWWKLQLWGAWLVDDHGNKHMAKLGGRWHSARNRVLKTMDKEMN